MKRNRPLVWIALAYALGIAVTVISPTLTGIAAVFCVTSFVLNRLTKREQWGWFALGCLVGVFSGLMFQATSRIPDGDISHFAPRTITVFGTVESDVDGSENPQAERRSKLKLTLRVQAVELEPGRMEVSCGKIAVRLPAESNHAPEYGDSVKIRGRLEIPDTPRNPGSMDYRAFLARQGVYSTMAVRRVNDWQILPVANLGNPMIRVAYALRDRIQSTPYRFLTPDLSGTLNGIVLGTHNDLPGQLRDDFQRTGTAHILSASGMNVAFVIVLSLWFFRLLPFTFRYANHLTLALVWLYALMANSQPSIVRAAVMGTIILVGVIIEREPDFANSIALGALILLVPHPQNLFDMGFQLSFAAIISLALFIPSGRQVQKFIEARFPDNGFLWKLARKITLLFVEGYLAVVAVQLGTLPLIAYYFSSFSLVGLLANGLVVPLVGLIMALGLAGVLFGSIHTALAIPIYTVLKFLLTTLIAAVTFFADLPYASRNTPLDFRGACLWYFVIAIIAWGWNTSAEAKETKRGRTRKGLAVFAVFSLMLIFVGGSCYRRLNRELRVTFLDVGQGDSCVIETPSGKVIVIDAGNVINEGEDDQGRRVVAPYLRYRGINQIDLLILTHPDADHIGGAKTLLHEFPVKMLLENGQFSKTDSALVSSIMREAKRKNTLIKTARRGQQIKLGDGVKLNILAPTESMMNGTTNDASIVLRLDSDQNSFLFTGDAGFTEEADILAANLPVAADVLKAGHHGSKGSTSESFARAVQPKFAVFSCGKRNLYGHPHPDVVNRLQTLGTKLYRTDTQGAMICHSDGVTIYTETTLKENSN